jgi:hypothetical protein
MSSHPSNPNPVGLPPTSPKKASTAFAAAHAFRALAHSFFSQCPSDNLDAANGFVAQRFPQLMAAATNLALALELYLKGLALCAGIPVKKVHDLLQLFEALPKRLQDSIEENYNNRNSRIPGDLNTGFHVLFTPTEEVPSDTVMTSLEGHTLAPGTDVRSILRAERDAFKNWRYLFEAADPSAPFLIAMDYGRLFRIADALSDHYRTDAA